MTISRGVALGVLAPAGVLALLAAVAAASLGKAPAEAYEAGAAVVGVVAATLVGLAARPAWPLSIGLALTAFSGQWDTMDIPVALDRLMIGTAIVSILVRDALHGSHALRARPIDLLLVLVALYALCSALLAGTLDDHEARFALLDRLSLVGFVLFFVAPRVYREAHDRQILLGVLVSLGGYLGVTAVLETTGPSALLFPSYIADPDVGIHHGRARGPLVEATANGLVLFACGVAAAVAAVHWTSRRRRQLALIVAGLCALGVLLTLTRAIWASSVVAVAAALLTTHRTRRLLVPAGVIGGVLVLGAFTAIPGLQARAEDRFNDKRPVWDRKNSNAAALRMIEARPMLGFGWGSFPGTSLDYYRQSPDFPMTLVRDVHNVYLVNAVELGLIGGGLWLVTLAVVLAGAVLRRGPPGLWPWKVGLVAIACSYLITALLTPLAFPLPTLLLWTWAGLAWGPDRRRPEVSALPAGIASRHAP